MCLNQWHCLSHSQSQLTFTLTNQPRGTLQGNLSFVFLHRSPCLFGSLMHFYCFIFYFSLVCSTDVPKNFTVKWATKTTVVLAWNYNQRSPFNCTVSLDRTSITAAVYLGFLSLKSLRLLPGSPLNQIEYNRQKMVVDAKRMRVLINGLKHNTSYNFTVTCQESTDGGPRHRVTAKTAPFIVLKKPKLDIYAKPENMLTMSFSPVDVKDIRWV